MKKLMSNRSQKHNHFRPSLEMLECRLVPAATAVLTAGVLTFTGDNLANEIHVTQDAHDRITITSPDTVINGQAVNTPIVLKVTKGMTFNMNGGNDKVYFDSSTSFNNEIDLPAFLTINGGAGDNLVEFGGNASKGVTINGGLTITNLVGKDTLRIHDELFVQGGLTVSNGDGGSLIEGDATTSLRAGNVKITNGKGGDEIKLGSALLFHVGTLSVNNNATGGDNSEASGYNQVTISPSGMFSASSVAIMSGNGGNGITLGSSGDRTIVAGAVVVNTAGGGTGVIISGAKGVALGSLSITTGQGSIAGETGNAVRVGSDASVVIYGAVTVKVGSPLLGVNSTFFSATDSLYIGGAISITGSTSTGIGIKMEYPLIHQSNQRQTHFIEGYVRHLADKLGIPLDCTVNRPYVYLTDQEKSWNNQVAEMTGYQGHFWLVCSGIKDDFKVKGWPFYQSVVDHYRGLIQFVQVGESHHNHAPLDGAINFIGRTDLRQLIRLAYHASGILCGESFLHHLGAALQKPTVCIASGMTPRSWQDYGNSEVYLTMQGRLPCCRAGGCWHSKVVKEKGGSACELPVFNVGPTAVPKCMVMIPASQVIDAIQSFYLGGLLAF